MQHPICAARDAQYRAARAAARIGVRHPLARLLLAAAAVAAGTAWDAGHRVADLHCTRSGEQMTTKHTHGPNFGRRIDGCPRCEELTAGAAPVQRHGATRRQEEQRAAEIRHHNCRTYGCGVVCTYGDW